MQLTRTPRARDASSVMRLARVEIEGPRKRLNYA
jgi:hypothetical protein